MKHLNSSRYRVGLLCFFLNSSLAIPAAAAGSEAATWAAISHPSTSADGGQSIGSYTAGCIAGAATLPLQGPGYQVMRLSRKRYYGHPLLVDFIQQLGLTAEREGLGSLLIGDLGQPRGGPTPSGHRSHQTGLDVDIWFLLLQPAETRILSAAEREAWNAPSVVDGRADAVDRRQWTAAHAKILEAAASQPEVDRIFVNPSIKQELCNRKALGSSGWLRKIRPWWKHDDHFHVRLKCPPGNGLCQAQEPLPAGDGCDASLAWWFSEEAKAPGKSAPQPAPPLPPQCERVLQQP
ncbi:penicillin-insensitive murein endopeptidase [Methylomonas sp. SURF-1]|uniref:Penicillin-insensitive murein endopeptidase n=1 Tax=Methylomonas aurea TaxID=2952224 RepID=A0ABT1UHI6_9GAMM|nr:penicillin-insensitive murein endopeptidase [Methylomonas sp. SURF-1]MCQ8181687.1 penicillin-insensitive murein endopeptidase [Methylomonas sp. SURF-1]